MKLFVDLEEKSEKIETLKKTQNDLETSKISLIEVKIKEIEDLEGKVMFYKSLEEEWEEERHLYG